MNLYILAIGGTGSRILKSMVMQLAAGVVPMDTNNHPIEDLTIVPIIIDPHQNNAALESVNQLLKNYRSIRKLLYKGSKVGDGFFAVNVDTLKSVALANTKDTTYSFNDSFVYQMAEVTNNEFSQFIKMSAMDDDNKLLTQMLYSPDELSTKMSEGFYGSPNIGTVALNIFKESDNFAALEGIVKQDDRMFFIGSIFGGTGAAGMPMFISSLRHDEKNQALSKIPYGALVVMPYFSIQTDENSKIHEADFRIKTKTALRYYEHNVNPYVNSIYYIADPLSTQQFKNDDGKGGQRGNKNHVVEFIGGLSIVDFVTRPFDKDEIAEQVGNRVEAIKRDAYHYKLEQGQGLKHTDINILMIDKGMRKQLALPMMQFHLLTRFIKNHLDSETQAAFAKENQISGSSITTDFNNLMHEYEKWLFEMGNHEGFHSLRFFEDQWDPDSDEKYPYLKDYTHIFKGILPQDGKVFGKKTLEQSDITKALNNSFDNMRKNFQPDETPLARLLKMGFPAMEKVISDKLDLKNIK